MTIGALPSGMTPRETNGPDSQDAETRRRAGITEAATQFESVLVQQLISVMQRSLGEGGLFGNNSGSAMYSHMFNENLSTAIAGAGGFGLRQVIERSMLGVEAYESAARDGQALRMPDRPFVPVTQGAVLEARPTSGSPITGATGTLQNIAREMLPHGVAPQWGRAGRLTENDLASTFHTESAEGAAMFNVRDASGFEGNYKCNLFAFEMVRRAGFDVPLIGRQRGWGYMGPDGVTEDADRGELRGQWGQIVTGESAASLDSSIVRGERAFMLTGSSVGDRAGHMGVVERVHEIDYDDRGNVRRIVFDGWEGRAQGARHLVRRTWNRHGNPGGNDARGGFESIQIIELSRTAAGQRPERPLHQNARPSVHDDFFSRFGTNRPTEGTEETQ